MYKILFMLSIIAFSNLSFGQLVDFQITHLGTHHEYVYDEGAAEIAAYDPMTQNLFVVNANDTSVDIINISDPKNPTKTGAIDISPYGAGANSVDITGPVLVIAVEAENKQANGQILFYSIQAGSVIWQEEAGALPDMVKVSHGGNIILAANEGEPNDEYTVDPEGSITMIEYNGPQSIVATQINFNKFDGMYESLKNRGVKLFGPNASVSQDLEPEYIAFSDDDKYAYVSCQENNCFAVVDLEAKEVIDLLPLGYKIHALGAPSLETVNLNEAVANWPELGTPVYDGGQDPVMLGGFSGLWVDPLESNEDEMVFYVVPDRGPNDATVDNPDGGRNLRPFKLPDYQGRIVKFRMNIDTKAITLDEEIMLTQKDGTTPISGRGNIEGIDEVPVTYADPNTDYSNVDYVSEGDEFHALAYDPYGGDFEGVIRVAQGPYAGFWMCDEYRPAIYHFDLDGTLIERYVTEGISQEGTNPMPEGTYGAETLPAAYAKRRANRGFEAIAWDFDNDIIYAVIQSPIESAGSSVIRNNSDVIRILGINPMNGEPVAEYVYLLEDNAFNGHKSSRVDKIGDAVYLGERNLMIIERDSSPMGASEGKKYVFSVDLNSATNILGSELSSKVTSEGPDDKTLEMMTAEDLKANGINPAYKIKVMNLPSIGYTPSDKAEGIGFYVGEDDIKFVVMNDNDFGLAGAGMTDNSQLGIISFDGDAYSLDASNRDAGYNPQAWDVIGVPHPDGFVNYFSNGKNYYVTANEGDARDYDGYSEEERVKDLVLDENYFGNAEDLQQDENLGRLNTTTALGDIDDDGEHEYIFSYGTRSMSIFDEYGNLVYDSANEIMTRTYELYPDDFNSNDDFDSFDSRSDDKGAEPENVVIGEIEGESYAFLCLERIGGFMVFNITDVTDVRFVTYVNNRDFSVEFDADEAENITEAQFEAIGDIGPEGILFIPTEESPNGKPLVVTSNEISGSTSIFQVDLGTSVEDHDDSFSKIINYVGPNPFDSSTTVHFLLENTSEVEITLTDMSGNRVLNHKKQYPSGHPFFTIHTDGLSSGMYILKVTVDGKSASEKIIKK